MKLLLTSAGLTNTSLQKAFMELLDKTIDKTKIVYVPTAANIEPGGKEWLVKNMQQFVDLHPEEFNIADISALPKDRFLPIMQNADVLVFGGGNAYYLMHWIQKSGLIDAMDDLVKDKVYVGISAGSMIAAKDFEATVVHDVELYGEEVFPEHPIKDGLGFVDFHIIPHFNSEDFPKVRLYNLEQYAAKTDSAIYALDDISGIQVLEDKIEVISSGEWNKFK